MESDKLFLYVDLPRFDFPVVFAEQVSPSKTGSCLVSLIPMICFSFFITHSQEAPTSLLPNLNSTPWTIQTPSPLPPKFLSYDPHLWRIYDAESIRIRADNEGDGNLVEAKYAGWLGVIRTDQGTGI